VGVDVVGLALQNFSDATRNKLLRLTRVNISVLV